MKKKEIIDEMVKVTDIPRTDVELIYEAWNDIVHNAVMNHEIISFGHVLIRGIRIPEKRGIHNITKEPYHIPERTIARVNLSPAYRRRLRREANI